MKNNTSSELSIPERPPSFSAKENGEAFEGLSNLVASYLPLNYNFELQKTLNKLIAEEVKHVALQLPEGLLTFATQIAHILKHFIPSLKVTIMGDVSYGACCIDDYSARAIGCDFIVHYGHSCLVPISITFVRCMYVFVEIFFDPSHLCETIKLNFKKSHQIALLATIQYARPLHGCLNLLKESNYFDVTPYVPQTAPLTAGEVLGCTSPLLNQMNEKRQEQTAEAASNCGSQCDFHNTEVTHNEKPTAGCSGLKTQSHRKIEFAIFIADGRFHLESAMIQNPEVVFYRYDPFTKAFLKEYYDHKKLHKNRKQAIEMAKHASSVGIIMGTLGRQGNIKIVEAIREMLRKSGKSSFLILLCEIMPGKIDAFSGVDAFVQVACPRLSIDWGHHFSKPLLSPYECFVAFGNESYKSEYPMDFYSKRGGAWTNYHSGTMLTPNSASHDADEKRVALRKRIAQKREQRNRMDQVKVAYEGL